MHITSIALLICLLLVVGCAMSAQSTQPQTKFRSYKRPVMTWVPPYAVGKAREKLTSDLGMADAITHLGLQFWIPTKTGGVEFAPFPEVTDANVIELRDWCHANGLRVMLCVYNAPSGKWDWPLARSGFADHPREFARVLVAEMERLNMDGVDIDLEGDGDYPPSEKEPFIAFMKDLSKEIHARHKHLTVDTFAYEWHAPNQKWWPELFPLVDGLTTMGYTEIGMTATPASDPWRAYAAQRDVAGNHKQKLMIGLPAGKDEWRGNKLAEQLDWIRKDGTTGLSFWDAQIPAKSWQTKQTWETIRAIRGSDR